MSVKKFALAIAAFAMSAAGASAADMAVKAPPAVVSVGSWTGWYAGLNAGGTWSNSDGVSHTALAGPCNAAFIGCTSAPPFSTTLATGSTFNTGFGSGGGFTGGGQFGYNWQFNGKGVAGFEADLAWTDQKKTSTFASLTPNAAFPAFPEPYTATVTRNLDYLGTVRGRLGFLATPSVLLYGTGGLAYGGTRSSTVESTNLAACGGAGTSCPGVGGGGFSQIRVGWTVGAGSEWMFARDWTAKVEYLYYDLGRVNYATGLSQFCNGLGCVVNGGLFASTTGSTSLRYNGSIARVGINYHFNGPAIARY